MAPLKQSPHCPTGESDSPPPEYPLGRSAGTRLPPQDPVVPHRIRREWTTGTGTGTWICRTVATVHLPSYLDEFGFRFNRRACSSGGLAFYRLLERAVNQDPLDNHELVAHRSPQPERPHAQRLKKAPPSLDLPHAKRPWRLADPAPPHSGSMDAPIHMKRGWPPSRGSRACRGYRLKDRAALKASWRPRR